MRKINMSWKRNGREPFSGDYVVFTEDDEVAYCDQKYCGGKLNSWRNDAMICSLCEYVYSADSTKLHKSGLHPNKSPYETDGPILERMDEYSTGKKKKAPTPGAIEDHMMVQKKSGMSIISYEDYLPEDDRRE
jgi:hypothetical protein